MPPPPTLLSSLAHVASEVVSIDTLLVGTAAGPGAATNGTDSREAVAEANETLPDLPGSDLLGLAVGALLGALAGSCCYFAVRGVRAEVNAFHARLLVQQTEDSQSWQAPARRVSFAAGPEGGAPGPFDPEYARASLHDVPAPEAPTPSTLAAATGAAMRAPVNAPSAVSIVGEVEVESSSRRYPPNQGGSTPRELL